MALTVDDVAAIAGRLAGTDAVERCLVLSHPMWEDDVAALLADHEALVGLLREASAKLGILPGATTEQAQEGHDLFRRIDAVLGEGVEGVAVLSVACIRCGREAVNPPLRQSGKGRGSNVGRWYTNSWYGVPNSDWYACSNCIGGYPRECWAAARATNSNAANLPP